MTPLSMPTMMRGKSVEGNTATGMEKAWKAPTNAITTMMKITDLELWTNHGRRLISTPAAAPFLIFCSSAMISFSSFFLFSFGATLPFAFLFRRGLLDLDLGFIRQALGSLGQYLLPGIQTGKNLYLVSSLDAGFYIAQFCLIRRITLRFIFITLGFWEGSDHH